MWYRVHTPNGEKRGELLLDEGRNRESMQVQLEEHGVETIRCDLLDREAVAALPDARNVIYMAGRKFGTQPLAIGEMFKVQPQIDGQLASTGPVEIGAARDRHIVIAVMARKRHSGASDNPARSSRISALSFHTSVDTILPLLDTYAAFLTQFH